MRILLAGGYSLLEWLLSLLPFPQEARWARDGVSEADLGPGCPRDWQYDSFQECLLSLCLSSASLSLKRGDERATDVISQGL